MDCLWNQFPPRRHWPQIQFTYSRMQIFRTVHRHIAEVNSKLEEINIILYINTQQWSSSTYNRRKTGPYLRHYDLFDNVSGIGTSDC